MRNKRAEIDYILFLAIFITLMGILSTFMVKQIVNEDLGNTDTGFSILDFGDELLTSIPAVGYFWQFVKAGFSFSFIHPYLSILYTSLFGIPLAYIILKLVRGGG